MPETIFDADGPEEVQAILHKVLNEVAKQFDAIDYRQPLREQVVPLLVAEHEDYFNRESGPLGKWPALAQRTVKKKGFDTILIETNTMRSSLLFDGPDHVEDVEERYLVWGTSDEKAAIHQYGTEGTPRIPQRAFVGVSEQTTDAIAEVAADAAVAVLKG